MAGGGSGIRTHGRLAPTAVFKTAALNRSAIPPITIYFIFCKSFTNIKANIMTNSSVKKI